MHSIKLVILIGIALLWIPTICFSQCPPSSVIINTQQDIIDFNANYPTCKNITGNLSIDGATIVDLSLLNSIENISGSLEILNTSCLEVEFENLINVGGRLKINDNNLATTINGFPNLQSVGFELDIVNNANLNNIVGFNSLIDIPSRFFIDNNASLELVSGFNSLNNVVGQFIIRNNAQLDSLKGFQNFTVALNDFWIILNPELVYISEFPSFQTVGDVFQIKFNNKLENIVGFNGLLSTSNNLEIVGSALKVIDGFNNLVSVNGDLEISFNPVLNSINAFGNLNTIGGDFDFIANTLYTDLLWLSSLNFIGRDVNINSNPNLSICDIICLLNITNNIGGIINISNNSTGCNTLQEVNASCANPCDGINVYVNPVIDNINSGEISIISDAIINTSQSILFEAGNLINLDPGFEVTASTNFTAQIWPCY